ncbi:PEP-CTERM sorting domain-containing protein [Rubrivivax albus]|uniref:PEP-CTERM sorting domain-containing protein n=1 Tax=Rubrivivax albus TaxID=2499835 RepID=A0A3S2TZA2_9BURK|nr:PEP-CTERM sorting domain-containing protein [Rubrivivax albus]
MYVNVVGLPGLAGQQIVLSAVPEPAAAGLLALGLTALAWLRRRSGTARSG